MLPISVLHSYYCSIDVCVCHFAALEVKGWANFNYFIYSCVV